MKKNIKFIGAAAAALLAVAPVVASSTANAAVSVNNAPATQTSQTTAGTVTVNVALTATAGKTNVGEALKTAKVTVDGATLANTDSDNYTVKIAKAGSTTGLSDSTVLEANQAYQVLVNGLKVKGLTTGNVYAISGGTIAGKGTANASNLNNGVDFTSDSFYVFDKSLTGNPYVVQNGSYVTKGSVDVAAKSSVSTLASAITSKYSVSTKTTGTAEGENFSSSAVENAIRAALKEANVTVAKDGSFSAPATNFTVTLTGYASNGNTVSFPVTVNVPAATVSNNAPVFKQESSKAGTYSNVNTKSNTADLKMSVGALVNANIIANDFSATINGDSSTKASVVVKSSNLNTSVAGTYTVVLEATNPSGKTTDFTVNVTVGNPGKTATVQAGTTTAKVVTISGNTVTPTDTTLSNGAEVATYGTVTINGTSYTRLNSSSSNQFVETQYVNGSIKAATTTSKTIMHIAQYYNNKGEKTTLNGKNTIGAYNEVTVYENPVTINGSKYYQIADSTVYIKAGNVDGTSRKLTHNAYIYNNKGKRVQKNTVLKKGTSKTTYGSAFSIKQNGVKKSMYRIGKNQYVKKANF